MLGLHLDFDHFDLTSAQDAKSKIWWFNYGKGANGS